MIVILELTKEINVPEYGVWKFFHTVKRVSLRQRHPDECFVCVFWYEAPLATDNIR